MSSPRAWLSREPAPALRYALSTAAILASIYSAVLGSASHLVSENTAVSAALAAHLVPYNSEYLVREAGWDVKARTALLQRAVAFNPFDTNAWIDLGFDAEVRHGDVKSAEKYFLNAAAANHMFLPKWTLTNFYFRRDELRPFLRWANQTLAITPYSATPVFSEMWLLDPNAADIDGVIPDLPNTLWQYAWFLKNARQWTAIPRVVARLVAAAGGVNPETYGKTTILGPILDELLANGYPNEALQVWRSLSAARWIQLPAPTAERPLVNAAFSVPFWGHGFDWFPSGVSGVAMEQNIESHTVQFELSGDEPEHCTLLQHWLLLEPGRRYRLSWNATLVQLQSPSGLSWHVRRVKQQTPGSPDLLDKAQSIWTFDAPEGDGLALLTLEYARPLGQTRAKGHLSLTQVSLLGIG